MIVSYRRLRSCARPKKPLLFFSYSISLTGSSRASERTHFSRSVAALWDVTRTYRLLR